MEGEPRDADGELIANAEFGHSEMLAEQLSILGPVANDDDKRCLSQQLRDSSVVLFQQFAKSIGVMDNRGQDLIHPYLRREEPGYNGTVHMTRDRARLTNIAKLNLLLDTAPGAKDYIKVLKALIDLERMWGKSHRAKEDLGKPHKIATWSQKCLTLRMPETSSQ